MPLLAHSRRRPVALTALVLASTALAAPVAPVVSAAGPCKVTNTTTHVSKPTLQAAVDAAAPGHTLEVRGTCIGSTTIRKRLSIVGKPSATLGQPILGGVPATARRVLTITRRAVVSISSLTVRRGDVSGVATQPENSGGGILNQGTLTLRNVLVTENTAELGGGIATTGPLVLLGTTRLTANSAIAAGGLYVPIPPGKRVTVSLADRARIDHNESRFQGGGIIALRTRLLMSGASQVDHNAGTDGAGVALARSTLSMGGASRIHHNIGQEDGGGVKVETGSVTMSGSSRIFTNSAILTGGGVHVTDGKVVMKDRAQVDGNIASDTGGIKIVKGSLTMSGASSVHDNTAGDHAGILLFSDTSHENRMTMNDTSSVVANESTGAESVAAVSVAGDLVMNDRSVIRDHDSTLATRAVDVYLLVPGGTPSITMTGRSRIRDNDLAPGGLGALVLWPDCGSPVTKPGTSGRVVNNTPANIVVFAGC